MTERESVQVGDFETLVGMIAAVHQRLQRQAARAVNSALTMRNWLIGCYVHEYELGGRDRADYYGELLLERLAERLMGSGIPRTDVRELRRYRAFFLIYPQVREALPLEYSRSILSHHLDSEIRETVSPESRLSGHDILRGLTFSHISDLLSIDDPTKRAFYEVEAIKGQWSVRQLRRQIATLLYERTGLSHDKEVVVADAHAGARTATPGDIFRDPYVFEFLGFQPREVMRESDLEAALIDKVQEFLLELGRGFCFEARQKRIQIGDDRFFVDLVFYHRILKCHILIELKADEFRHEHLGQLNTYVTWFRRHERAEGDNPPIGLLLCTGKNHALVEYALAGMDNNLFVSKYLLALPEKEAIQRFIDAQLIDERDGTR